MSDNPYAAPQVVSDGRSREQRGAVSALRSMALSVTAFGICFGLLVASLIEGRYQFVGLGLFICATQGLVASVRYKELVRFIDRSIAP
jgi:hypothetical protein